MNRVCSLDFLNSEYFTSDIKTSDGLVLFHAGDKITPEIILKLYFKEIYTDESAAEKIAETIKDEIINETEVEVETEVEAKVEAEAETEVEAEAETEVEAEVEAEAEEEVEAKVEAVKSEAEITEKAEILTSTKSEIEAKTEPEAEIEEKEKITEETKTEKKSKKVKGPTKIESSAAKEKSEENADIKGPQLAQTDSAEVLVEEKEDAKKGPHLADSTLDIKLEEKEGTKGPRLAQKDLISEDKDKKGPKLAGKENIEAEEEVIIKENPENKLLEFNENTAKRIVKYSLAIGKMLDFSPAELNELEQVAYYCNIGITKFKVTDSRKKGFSKMKFYESYQKLLNEETVSSDVAEMIKQCANNYESENFPLNSKIPCQHIVSMTSYYEDLLAKNNSKEETLLKMLQMGGNRFNIFILHKFIRMMSEMDG